MLTTAARGGASTRASGSCSPPPAPAPARRSCRRSPAAGRRPSSTCRATPRPSAATSRPLRAKATSPTRCGRSTFSRTHFTWRRSFAWCRARPFCDSSDTDRLDRQWVWVGSYPDRMADARPLLLLAIPVALGAKAGANAPTEAAWILVALAALLLLLALAARRVPSAAALAALTFAVAGGAASAEAARYDASPLRQWTAAHEDAEAPVSLRGVAVSDGRAGGDRRQIILDVESLELRGQDQGVTGRVRPDVGGSSSEDLALIEGDRVEAWAVLR